MEILEFNTKMNVITVSTILLKSQVWTSEIIILIVKNKNKGLKQLLHVQSTQQI